MEVFLLDGIREVLSVCFLCTVNVFKKIKKRVLTNGEGVTII